MVLFSKLLDSIGNCDLRSGFRQESDGKVLLLMESTRNCVLNMWCLGVGFPVWSCFSFTDLRAVEDGTIAALLQYLY